MKLKYYEIDEERLLEEAKGKKIAIKLPEGFIPYATKILDFLEENGIKAFLLAESCYGACDFVSYKEIEKIICIGEAEMPYLRKKYESEVAFIEARYDFDVSFLNKAFKFLGKKVGLVSITPYMHKLKECKEYLEKNGYEVFIGKKSRRTAYDGQILGCDFSSAISISNYIDTFLFIGDGFFHPVGLYLAIKKNVVVANPIEKRIYAEEIKKEADKILKKRYAMIAKAMDAEKFGIIVSRKLGQKRMELARRLKKLIDEKGKKAYLIILNDIDEKIDYMEFDCYISTACPRVAIDDMDKYEKPILTPIELEILLNERKWENYEFDQIL